MSFRQEELRDKAVKVTLAELDAARSRIERLEEALREIRDLDTTKHSLLNTKTIARNALSQDTESPEEPA